MLKRREYEVYSRSVRAEAGGKDATVDKVLDVLFGEDSEYVVYYENNPYNKSTFFNRLNMLWVYPIYLLVFALPIYLITGSTGVSQYSWGGKILTKLIGKY